MRKLLARRHEEVLARLARSRVLLAFDFDGTLAPIVPHREAARMRAPTRKLFTEVCDLYPCAVISGRARKDVQGRLDAAAVKYVVGNHGIEPAAMLDELEAEITQARDVLGRSLAGLPGVDLEDKRYSLTVHYRRSRSQRAARGAILAAVEALPVRMRVVPGKFVVNLVPEGAPNKGDALLALLNTEHADAALYVGDDVTDEDVFEIDQPERLLTVRVGESRSSAAAYFLRDQREIDRLLARLVALRAD